MKNNLEGAGYVTQSTHLGEEAVIFCRENHFDLVYCYLNMCGMNGFEVCTKIMAACNDTKVILFAVSSKETNSIGLTLWQPDDRKRLFEECCSIADLAFYTQKLLHS